MVKKPKATKEYWIDVHPDGREEIFAEPPSDEKTLHVWVQGRHELTKTYDIRVGDKETLLHVRPKSGPGREWEMTDCIDEMFSTVWRRRRGRRNDYML